MIRYLFEKRHSNIWAICMFILGNAWGHGYYWQSIALMIVAAIIVAFGEVLYEGSAK